jgi:class 3 adenylate cyclase
MIDHGELRLFLEEICSNVCRFRHAGADRALPEAVAVDQEVFLGVPGAYADIRVDAPGSRPYFVEVKYGYSPEHILESLHRKYGPRVPLAAGHDRVVLVVDQAAHPNWPAIEAAVRGGLGHGLGLEVWDEVRLLELLDDLFGVRLGSLSADGLLDAREAIDRAKGAYAFGPARTDDALERSLLWHFGFWRLRNLRERGGLGKRDIIPPGTYRDVAVLFADICSFSSYVRDTLDESVIRASLTAFYAKARYQIINSGGLLYQFLGDGVIGLFGLPDRVPEFADAALHCAHALAEVGRSVANEWQRRIDRVQSAEGVHIGMAMGDLELMSLRPFGRAHMGAIGDCINMAARLCAVAGPSDVVVSNTFFQQLALPAQARFTELEPVDARNVGRIRAWKLPLGGVARLAVDLVQT